MAINLDKKLIKFDLDAKDRKDVINQLADLYVTRGIVRDKNKYLDSVEFREMQGTTGVGDGIAIPHGQTNTVTKSSIAIAELRHSVEWNSLDGKPVKFVFLLAIPEGGSKEHLKILSEVAGDLMDGKVRERLRKAKSAEDLLTLFD
ncbi:PTS sugar transporter subunit IIA [Lactobacillus corticis]|uniref:PTS mannose transporter subunit IIAB n=1 Tax=Lactobacillus corticis TaxID=2201249 RepID=A0A916QF50_9LACO|nr:fructose PTS transporter subunit IIA [Lactobacillus corticis]GFZ26149.1 PTS mannose transporter subunit IIAB [Lactobacillus corticis]